MSRQRSASRKSLRGAGHEIDFIGYEVQRKRIEVRGFRFTALRRSGDFDTYVATDLAERLTGLIRSVWACPEHLDDISDGVAASGAEVLIVDFLMQGALAAATQLAIPVAVLAHSTVAGLIPPPDSAMGKARLTAANQLRKRAGLPQMTRLNDRMVRAPDTGDDHPGIGSGR